MKNRCFGYDKNQVRVYFTALQSEHQRRLDQWEEKRKLLEEAVDQQKQQIQQLETKIGASSESEKYLEIVIPLAKTLQEQIVGTAREQAVKIVGEAREQLISLQKTVIQIDEQINRKHQLFSQPLEAVLSPNRTNLG